jgi:hypothetical protein
MADWTPGTTNISGAAFGNPTRAELASMRPAPAAPFRAAPASPVRPAPVAPTLAGGGLGGGFRSEAPTGEVVPGGNIGGNIEAANTPAPATPEVIRGTTRGAGDVHPSWQLYHNAGRGEDYPGAVAAFRRSEGEGALKAQEGAAERAAKIQEAKITGESHVEAQSAANKNPAYAAQAGVFREQELNLQRQREAKERGERGSAFDKYYQATYGGSIPKEGEAAHGDFLEARNWEQEHPGEGKQRYQENIQLRHIEPLWTPANLQAHGITIPPEVQQNPDLLRKTMLKFGPRLQQAQKESLATPTNQYENPGFLGQ